MDGNAYRLTLFNAICCGIPCALGYFVLGEGFSLLKGVHSYAELPSLLAQHTSLGVGLTSLSVDLFRAVDSFWHRRCWAPFGFLPLAINIPTYFKRLFQNGKRVPEKSQKARSASNHPSNKCQIDITDPELTDRADESDDYISENYSKTDQAISHSR